MATKDLIIRKYGPWGGPGGDNWDDSKYNHMRIVAIHLTVDQNSVFRSIQMDYVSYDPRLGVIVKGPKHGGQGCTTYEVDLSRGEELKHISGHYGYANNYLVIKSLKFETNQGKYGPFGKEDGTPFECLPMIKICGFFGRASSGYVDAIGIYAIPQPHLNICEEGYEEPKLICQQG
eukprot:Gb_34671 [translate_table: standard]